jgi:hypothetical protein
MKKRSATSRTSAGFAASPPKPFINMIEEGIISPQGPNPRSGASPLSRSKGCRQLCVCSRTCGSIFPGAPWCWICSKNSKNCAAGCTGPDQGHMHANCISVCRARFPCLPRSAAPRLLPPRFGRRSCGPPSWAPLLSVGIGINDGACSFPCAWNGSGRWQRHLRKKILRLRQERNQLFAECQKN